MNGVLQMTARRSMLASAGTLLVAVYAAEPACAQVSNEGFVRLLSAKTLKCVISVGTFAEWKSGEPKVVPETQGKAANFVLDAIDAKKGTARLVGGSETGEDVASDFRVMATPVGLTFMQSDPGLVDIITVFASHPTAGSKEFIAVESRHSSLELAGGLPVPSQAHGTCKVLDR
jgi:hypothetical protein